MPRRNRDTKAILRTIERSEQRSPLFWWMVEHHDEMVKAAKRRRINWAAFCAEAAKRGVTDTRGEPPTESNARKTWLRARREVEQARAAEATKPPPHPGSVFPSRIPKDWRPQVVPVPAAAVSGTAVAPGSACHRCKSWPWRSHPPINRRAWARPMTRPRCGRSGRGSNSSLTRSTDGSAALRRGDLTDARW